MNLSNSISLIRAPLALLFLIPSPLIRLIAILLATLTDCIDGYLARRYSLASKLGAILDPMMDKFFVYFALFVLYQEHLIPTWVIYAMLSRDFFLCIYGLYLTFTKKWNTVVYRSVRWGKITTTFQFILLSFLVLGYSFPPLLLLFFLLMGFLAFLELFQSSPSPA